MGNLRSIWMVLDFLISTRKASVTPFKSLDKLKLSKNVPSALFRHKNKVFVQNWWSDQCLMLLLLVIYGAFKCLAPNNTFVSCPKLSRKILCSSRNGQNRTTFNVTENDVQQLLSRNKRYICINNININGINSSVPVVLF